MSTTSSLAKRKEEKLQEELRKLSLLPENKTCMDCTLKSTPYVILDFGTFVCSACAGVHRSFQFKSKGISMTKFKEEEVQFIAAHGNEKARRTWRGKWTPSTQPKPNPNDERAIKDFIYKTYVEKRWYKEDDGEPVAESSEAAAPQPITNILPDAPKLKVESTKAATAPAAAAAAPTAAPKTAAPAETAKPQQGNLLDFFSDEQAVPAAKQATTASTGDNFANFDNFGAFEEKPKSTKDFADELFAGFGSTTTANPGFGAAGGFTNANAASDFFFSAPQPQPQPQVGNFFGGALQPMNQAFGAPAGFAANYNPFGVQPQPFAQAPVQNASANYFFGGPQQPQQFMPQQQQFQPQPQFMPQSVPLQQQQQPAQPAKPDPFSGLMSGFGGSTLSTTPKPAATTTTPKPQPQPQQQSFGFPDDGWGNFAAPTQQQQQQQQSGSAADYNPFF